MSHDPLTSDIAIVGAGITGLSIAFHLAERDLGTIVVYERDGIGAGASGVQPGGVRQQWSTRPNCLMARDSLAFYLQLEERLCPRVDPGFRNCGYVFVAHESETFDRLRDDYVPAAFSERVHCGCVRNRTALPSPPPTTARTLVGTVTAGY